MSKLRKQELVWLLFGLLVMVSLTLTVGKVEAEERKITVPIEISLPEESNIKVSNLMVLTFLDKIFLSSKELEVSLLVNNDQPIMINNQKGEIIMMGYVFGGELASLVAEREKLKKYSADFNSPIKIDARSTALSLTMMNLAMGSVEAEGKLDFAQLVLEHDKFSVLVKEVKNHLIEKSEEPLIKQENIRQLTGNIIKDVYYKIK